MRAIHLALVLAFPVPTPAQDADRGDFEPIYDPSPAYPFGRPHPDAPGELAQFAFLIGECDCVDEILQPDGTWQRTAAIWNARYFLNGQGIQDVYWSDTFATTNLRIFDPERGRWLVHFFRGPARQIGRGQWTGESRGEGGQRRMVMWAGTPDGQSGSRLTFHDIDEGGFEWQAESLKEGEARLTWKSSCRRRTPGRDAARPYFVGYDSTPAFPRGRRHPAAPVELEQLAFLVGDFASETTFATGGLEREPEPGRRSAHWILNGWGIQDHAYDRGRYSSSIYQWDAARRSWQVSTFRMPGYTWTVFEGAFERERLELREPAGPGLDVNPQRSLRLEPTVGGYTVHGALDVEGAPHLEWATRLRRDGAHR